MFQTRMKTHHSAMAQGKEYVLGPKNVAQVLREKPIATNNNGTIYIHVPFCKKICSFCNMRRTLSDPKVGYGHTIVKEIEHYSELPYIKAQVFDAVYFGGGTPTTLDVNELREILRALKKNFTFTKDAEFTIETTVTELDNEKLDMFLEEGVTRFSVGVQTFNDTGRLLMNRIGDGNYAYAKLKQIKEMGFHTVTMDLIYNYAKQTKTMLKDDLDKIISLGLDGFSMYSLINMKDTNISEAQNEEKDLELFNFIASYMKEAGYDFLELTKMVKSDKYKYIMNRHQGADTLPLGAGAGGSINGLAIMNPFIIEEYEASVDNFNERVGMHFAPSYKEITKFKGDIQTLHIPRNESLYKNVEQYNILLKRLIDEEMVVKVDDGYKLTQKGVFWGNSISRELSELI